MISYTFEAKLCHTTPEYFTSIVNIGAQHHPCGGAQVAKDPVPGHGGGPRHRQGDLHHELRKLGVQHWPHPVHAPDRALSQSAG